MEDKTEKKTIKERFKGIGKTIGTGFKKVGKVVIENKEIGLGILGFAGAVFSFITMKKDHKMTKEEQNRECEMMWFNHGWIDDPENGIEWYANMSNDDKKEMLQREKNGESRMDILKDMGKI